MANSALYPPFNDTQAAFAHLSDGALRKAYWMFYLINKRWLVRLGSYLVMKALALRMPIKPLIKKTIFAHFCGGETISECQSRIDSLAARNVGTILDYSMEGQCDDTTFDQTLYHLLETVHKAGQSTAIPFAVFKVTGLGSASVLASVQSKKLLSTLQKQQYQRTRERIFSLCQTAQEKNVRIFFDAEESWIQDTIDDMCYEMMSLFNKKNAIVFNTFQFYRRDMIERYQQALDMARKSKYYLGAKLVRGAYMEKERERAQTMDYPDPIHPDKARVDQDFDRAVSLTLNAIDQASICLGTHNERSCHWCVEEMRKHGIDKTDQRIYFAQLLGMSDNISFNMALAGYNVAKYVPFGPIEAVMPYLLRRANENSAISGQSSREFLLIGKELSRRKRRQS
jgi:proline dehydrogenase